MEEDIYLKVFQGTKMATDLLLHDKQANQKQILKLCMHHLENISAKTG